MDWDVAIRVFTAMGVPTAMGIAWYIRHRDLQRHDVAEATREDERAATAARVHADELKINAQNVVIAERSTDARMHEIALAAAETASQTWKDIVEDLRDHQFPLMRQLLHECERRDAANRERIVRLEGALLAAGIPLP